MKYLFFSVFILTSVNASEMGSLLFNGNCTTCHHEQNSVSAPSVAEFKNSYLKMFPLKEEFVDKMSKWIEKPNKETSLMPKSIKKYALMPELGYDINTLREISDYIYETDFNKRD